MAGVKYAVYSYQRLFTNSGVCNRESQCRQVSCWLKGLGELPSSHLLLEKSGNPILPVTNSRTRVLPAVWAAHRLPWGEVVFLR